MRRRTGAVLRSMPRPPRPPRTTRQEHVRAASCTTPRQPCAATACRSMRTGRPHTQRRRGSRGPWPRGARASDSDVTANDRDESAPREAVQPSHVAIERLSRRSPDENVIQRRSGSIAPTATRTHASRRRLSTRIRNGQTRYTCSSTPSDQRTASGPVAHHPSDQRDVREEDRAGREKHERRLARPPHDRSDHEDQRVVERQDPESAPL